MYYDRDGYPIRQSNNGAVWAIVLLTALAVAGFLAFLAPDILHAPGLPERTKQGAVGNQAPADVRGTLRGSDTFMPSAPQAAINDYNATAQAQYDAAIKAGGNPVLVQEVATPLPLPLNSAGQPVISQAQQAQQQLSLQLAATEGAAAADAQLAARRQAANADAQSRAPDVSAVDAAAELHRDPCHVPHANPATCAQGLFKPTPVN